MEIERSTLVRLGVSPDAASMALYHPLHDGQADPGAGKIRSLVKSLERAEHFLRLSHIETHAIVPYIKCASFTGRHASDFNAWV